MASEVDDRIVSMQFNNALFEKRVSDTIKSLDQLKSSLDFANAGRGFEQVAAAASRFNIAGIANSVDQVASRFTALGAVAFSVLNNITNRVIDAGVNLGKSLTVQPILEGFREYEVNMGSIQTILANTRSEGAGLADVNEALDQLNEYSDKTIYNFAQMAKNIGTFTAAGVELDVAVGSIKGIANLAALSGSSAEQAAGAMYQLSQAIAEGRVSLQTWNSVVNAGIGGKIFQESLFETAKALGTLPGIPIDTTFEEWEAAGNNFRKSLSGAGEALNAEQDRITKANADAADSIADAETRAADSIANAKERVIDAQERASDAAIDGAKDIEEAVQKQQDTFTEGTQEIEDALNAVTDARKKLEEALKPASERDLEEAQDRLTTAQLDQADLSGAIEKARRDQSRAADDLTDAEQALAKVQNGTDFEAIDAAYRRVQDARDRAIDSADAVTRAEIRQRDAARGVGDAEENLNEIKQKGSETDENVIDARENLLTVEEKYLKTVEDTARRQQEATDNVTRVREQAAERQADAAKALSKAEVDQSRAIIDAQENIAKAHENAAERIAAASKSAEDTWLTSEVLTTTLEGFSGDLDSAQLKALGYTDAQIAEVQALGQAGQDAATQVKTLTQLISTVRESVASGWSQSFRTVIGDFEQSKTLFTSINDAIGGFVERSATARNTLLETWAGLGGRDLFLNSLSEAFTSLKNVIEPVTEAFREFFPALTAEKLFELTEKFAAFTKKLALSEDTIDAIRRIFRGVFAALEIGINVVRGIAGVFRDFFTGFSDYVGLFDAKNGVLGFLANLGDSLVNLNASLIEGGGLAAVFEAISTAIDNFFASLGDSSIIENFVNLFQGIANAIAGVFSGGTDVAGEFGGLENVGTTFSIISAAIGAVGDALQFAFEKGVQFITFMQDNLPSLGEVFAGIGEFISGAFEGLGAGDIFSVLNVAVIGGLTAAIAKFTKSGGISLFSLFGPGDDQEVFGKVTDTLDELRNSLVAFQSQLKADALLKIAAAVALLAVSIVVLAAVDGDDLAKSLGAITVGFGQLVGTLAILSQLSGGILGLDLLVLSAGLVLLAGAVVILAFAMEKLSKLDLDALGVGLAGVAGLLAAMVGTVATMSNESSGLIRAGIGLTILAVGLNIMADAVTKMAALGWEELTRGLTGVLGALIILAGVMGRFPTGLIAAGVGIIAVALGLQVLALAIISYSNIEFETMLTGLVGIGSALLVIAAAVALMPTGMVGIGAGLLAVGIGLLAMATAIKILGVMDWDELGLGLGGLATALGLLAIALIKMSGSLAGAAALAIAAVGLSILAGAVKAFSKLPILATVTGLILMAGALTVLGVAASLMAPIVVPLIALAGALVLIGAALALAGAGFALFGGGVYLVAEGFRIIAEVGTTSIEGLRNSLAFILEELPKFVQTFAEGLLELAKVILEGLPDVLRGLGDVLIVMIEELREVFPEFAKLIKDLIGLVADIVIEKSPDIVAAGFALLINFLKGVRDNIEEVTKLVGEIIIKFLDTLVEEGIIKDIVAGGLGVLEEFLRGIAENIGLVTDQGTAIVEELLKAFGKNILTIAKSTLNFVLEILRWIALYIPMIADAGVDIVVALLEALSTSTVRIAEALADFVIDIVNGLADVIREKGPELRRAGLNLGTAIADGATFGLAGKVPGFLKALGGIAAAPGALLERAWAVNSPSKLTRGLAQGLVEGMILGVTDDQVGFRKAIEETGGIAISSFKDTIKNIPDLSLYVDDQPTITPVLDWSQVARDANLGNRLLSNSPLLAAVKPYQDANYIAYQNQQQSTNTPEPAEPVVREVKFEQNITSPKPLTPSYIYKQTKSQIALAKKELGVNDN